MRPGMGRTKAAADNRLAFSLPALVGDNERRIDRNHSVGHGRLRDKLLNRVQSLDSAGHGNRCQTTVLALQGCAATLTLALPSQIDPDKSCSQVVLLAGPPALSPAFENVLNCDH